MNFLEAEGMGSIMAERKAENSISSQALDKLIAAHDGDVALLWLHRLRNGGLDAEKAASDLCRTLQQIREAEEKLRRLDLPGAVGAPVSSPAPAPAPEWELPQYSAREIAVRSAGDPAMAVIYDEAAQVLGRALSANDMRVLLGMRDHLGLPPEVIVELLHFCQELCLWKYGESRRPTPRFLEQEAYAWAEREILTLELAEEHIRARRDRHSSLGRIRERLRLDQLSPTQEKDLNAWLEQGFGEEALAIAADRTITNTGALKWSYLRKILQSWQEKGLHSPQEIASKDPPRAARGVLSSSEPREQKPLSPEEWETIINKI